MVAARTSGGGGAAAADTVLDPVAAVEGKREREREDGDARAARPVVVAVAVAKDDSCRPVATAVLRTRVLVVAVVAIMVDNNK